MPEGSRGGMMVYGVQEDSARATPQAKQIGHGFAVAAHTPEAPG